MSSIFIHVGENEKYEVKGVELKTVVHIFQIKVTVAGRSGTTEVMFFMHPGEETYQFVRQMTKALLAIDHEDVLQVLVDEGLAIAK